MKSRSKFEVILMTALLVLATACTKKKAFVNEVDENGDGYIAKSAVAGKEYYLSAGIDDSQDDNQLYNATPGMTIDYGIVRAEITKDELRFVEVFNPQNRKATSDILAAYKIVKHFDIEREQNDFGEKTHRLIENTDRPWNQRAYIRVDWSNPVAERSKLGFQAMYGVKDLAVQNSDLVEPVSYKDGHLQFAVDATLVQPGAGQWGGSKNSRIKMRTHLVEVTQRDFIPLQYSERDFNRYGLFFTQQLFSDPLKGLRDSGVKHYAEKFNVCGPNPARSCSKKVVKWYFNEGFPEQYKELSRKAVAEYNDALKKILKREDNVVVLDESRQVSLTDPTVNTIAFYAPDQGGLGVRQNQVDPRTGEIVSARVVIYGSGINGIMGQIDDYIDMLVASGEGESIGLKTGEEKEEQKGISSLKSSAKMKVGSFTAVEKLSARRAALGLNTNGASGNLRASVRDVHDHISSERSNLDAKLNRMVKFATAERSNLIEVQKLKDNGIDEINDSESFIRDLLTKNTSLREEKLRAITPIKFANVQIEAQGFHGAEFVEEATLRFIERTLKKLGSAAKLSEQREAIKKEVAKNVFYDTLLHELGHAFGLRHNFAASSDVPNYTDEYKQKVSQIIKGDQSIKIEDLYGSSYSSVMDYPADFHIIDAGLGPYDKAALEYAYGPLSEMSPEKRNALLDKQKETHPLVKPAFKFCTDNNAGEDITCRRWDRGNNASMITEQAINSANSSYLMSHFRRDRVRFGGISRLINRLFERGAQIRQPMDEFLYALITAPTGGGCGSGTLAQAIARGEMFDICTMPAQAAKLGVDMNDMSTYYRALYDEKGNLIAKHPSRFQANGYADLLYASKLATDYFQDVLGAPEPGLYVALDSAKKEEVKLVQINERAASVEDALAQLAQERGDQPDAFVEKYKNRILEFKPGRFARHLESSASGDQIHRKVERLGFFWDKYVAMLMLSARDIGVQKYFDASMTANAYLLPQTQKVVHKIFENLITGSAYLTQIPVVIPEKDQVGNEVQVRKNALVPAKLNSDLEVYSTIISLSSFSAQSDRSFSQMTKICLDNEACLNSAGLEWMKFIGANGHEYKAAQTIEKNSIAVSLLKKGVELNKELAKTKAKISKRPDLKVHIVAKAQKNKADRAQSDLEKRLTEFVGDSTLSDALTKAFDDMIKIVSMTDGSKRPQMIEGFYGIRGKLDEAREAWIKKAIAKLQAAGEDLQKCQEANPDGSPKYKCPVLQAASALLGEMGAVQGKLYEAPFEAFDLASLEFDVERIQRDTNTLESKIHFLRSVHDAVNR